MVEAPRAATCSSVHLLVDKQQLGTEENQASLAPSTTSAAIHVRRLTLQSPSSGGVEREQVLPSTGAGMRSGRKRFHPRTAVDAPFVVLMMELCAHDGVRAVWRQIAAAAIMPSGGAVKYSQSAVQSPAASAEPKVRAGFMSSRTEATRR